MNQTLKRVAALAASAVIVSGLAACDSDSDVASKNLSKDADNFKVFRRVVLYNGITDTYVVTVEGYCSLGNDDPSDQVSVVCKMDDGKFIKDIFKKSDNTTVVTTQLVSTDVSTQRYKVIWKPSTVVPDVDVR